MSRPAPGRINVAKHMRGIVIDTIENSPSTGGRKWVARVNTGVHAGFLIAVAIAIWQSGALIDFWESFGY